MQPFRMTREEHPIDAREGSNELEIASMCKAEHFSYHSFFVSLDDFERIDACQEIAAGAVHPSSVYLISYTQTDMQSDKSTVRRHVDENKTPQLHCMLACR